MVWPAIIAGVASVASSAIGILGRSKSDYKYRPDPAWLSFQYDIMAGIEKGLEEGGYTFSEETANIIKRQALEAIGVSYTGAERRVREAMAPYGATGAMGRGLMDINVKRGMEESKAIRDVDIARATQKEQSRMGLLQLGSQVRDPLLPGYQGQLQYAQQPGWGEAIQAGLGVGYNVYQTDRLMNILENKYRPPSAPLTGLFNYGYAY